MKIDRESATLRRESIAMHAQLVRIAIASAFSEEASGMFNEQIEKLIKQDG